MTVDPQIRQQWQQQAAKALSSSQRRFAPDATNALAPAKRGEVLAQLPWLIELLNLVGTGETITMIDYERHHDAAKADSNRWRELLGFNPSAGTTRTFVANLLGLIGFRLERTQRRSRITVGSVERRLWHYEVMDDLAVLNRAQILKHLVNTEVGSFLV